MEDLRFWFLEYRLVLGAFLERMTEGIMDDLMEMFEVGINYNSGS